MLEPAFPHPEDGPGERDVLCITNAQERPDYVGSGMLRRWEDTAVNKAVQPTDG